MYRSDNNYYSYSRNNCLHDFSPSPSPQTSADVRAAGAPSTWFRLLSPHILPLTYSAPKLVALRRNPNSKAQGSNLLSKFEIHTHCVEKTDDCYW